MRVGREILYVDGYNVINAWPELVAVMEQVSLDAAREDLISVMAEYRSLTGMDIRLIFDAHRVKNKGAVREYRGGIEVIYTDPLETADKFIEAELFSHHKRDRIYVATSDGMIQKIILGRGGVRISSRELRQRILSLKKGLRDEQKKPQRKEVLGVHLDPEMIERLDSLRGSLERKTGKKKKNSPSS